MASTMALSKTLVPLNETEIEELYNDFDHDKDGKVSFKELEDTLKGVLEFLVPSQKRHQPKRSSEDEKATGDTGKPLPSDLHDFLARLMPGCGEAISKQDFFHQVRSWNVPSQDQTSSDSEVNDAKEYQGKLSLRRRLSAWSAVKGLEVAFLSFVTALILAFGLWQGLKYATNSQARSAFGAGLIVAKFSAGALYPTFFFLILSMSRWFATFCRRSYLASQVINWDLSQSFHIKMSSIALVLCLIHSIAHLTGTFVYGSSSNRQSHIQAYLGAKYIRRSYADFIGWTGLVALGCFIIIGLSSAPFIRKRYYEIFQLLHLLMYPMFVMLAIHGTAKLLQAPMLGYWIAFPVICVILERMRRFYLTFFSHHPARLEALDDGTVVITAVKPEGIKWNARAGQFVLLQVPAVSRFQWHPFTISTCIGNRLQVHIKADGDWTEKLHNFANSNKAALDDDYIAINVGIDGPFGAPAQRFYSFDKTIIVGSGIGVTPFSACLTDLEENFKAQGDPWKITPTRSFGIDKPSISKGGTSQPAAYLKPVHSSLPSEVTVVDDMQPSLYEGPLRIAQTKTTHNYNAGSSGIRRCDFHWSVREKNDLLWFSDLLNRASELADQYQNLTLNIRAHITGKRKKLSTHTFWYLLDAYRTKSFPCSALTGLRITSEFGRADYEAIITEYYEDMKAQGWRGKIGVFHCGPPVVGKMLADQCSKITSRAAAEGNDMRFIFHNEVFG